MVGRKRGRPRKTLIITKKELTKELSMPKYNKDQRDPKDPTYPRDPREPRDQNDTKDQRDNRDNLGDNSDNKKGLTPIEKAGQPSPTHESNEPNTENLRSNLQYPNPTVSTEPNKTDSHGVPTDLGESNLGRCPWCTKQLADKVKDYPKDSKIVMDRTTYQCTICGKNWGKADLGKPWTVELERGEAWTRENAARKLVR